MLQYLPHRNILVANDTLFHLYSRVRLDSVFEMIDSTRQGRKSSVLSLRDMHSKAWFKSVQGPNLIQSSIALSHNCYKWTDHNKINYVTRNLPPIHRSGAEHRPILNKIINETIKIWIITSSPQYEYQNQISALNMTQIY